MKEKAGSQLAELRKGEETAKPSYDMLNQSLEAQISADTKDMKEEKAGCCCWCCCWSCSCSQDLEAEP